jgi:hypothetical protein
MSTAAVFRPVASADARAHVRALSPRKLQPLSTSTVPFTTPPNAGWHAAVRTTDRDLAPGERPLTERAGGPRRPGTLGRPRAPRGSRLDAGRATSAASAVASPRAAAAASPRSAPVEPG